MTNPASAVEMADIRCCGGLPGDPDVFLPALQGAESAGDEGDGPRPGSGPRGVPGCTQLNRKYVPALTV